MRVKDLFNDVKNSALTTLDKMTALEIVTDNYDPEKLTQLRKDLVTYIKNTRRLAGIDLESVFADCLYEAFLQSHKNNKPFISITKERFRSNLAKYGPDLPINKTMLMLAFEIFKDKYGESYTLHMVHFMELKFFEKMVEDKIQEIKLVNESQIEPIHRGRKYLYDIKDTERWFNELSQNPDYQHSDGTPNLSAIDIELIISHHNKTGQRPSETTIKNHRRELGFMQK